MPAQRPTMLRAVAMKVFDKHIKLAILTISPLSRCKRRQDAAAFLLAASYDASQDAI